MANRARTAPLTQSGASATLSNDPDPMQPLDNVKEFYNSGKNRTIINAFVIGLVVVVGGYFGYKYLYQIPREKKAADRIFWAQEAFAKDSADLALKGETGHPGFLKIIKDYSGTKSANLAHFYAGVCFLKAGDAKSAIKHLKDFDGEGTMAGTAAHGALGNAYAENGNWNEAMEQFRAASKDGQDEAQTPIYLMALATASEKAKKPEEAKKAYLRIRDEFPNSTPARDVDRHLARLGVLD